MPKNKYQRRRSLREPTFPLPINNEPLQGAIQLPTNQSTDLGREDARQLREASNPNTRFIDKPKATTSKRQLTDALSRQQALIRETQRQVLGSKAVTPLKPAGKFFAPTVPSNPLVFKGGAVHFQPTVRGSIITTFAGIASELITQPVADAISNSIINPLIGKLTGNDIPPVEELRQINQFRQEIRAKDAERSRLYQQRLSDERMSIEAGEAPTPPSLPLPTSESSRKASKPFPRVLLSLGDSSSSESHFKVASKTHSTSPKDDERNREYLIRRSALGDNPTQAEMDAVVAYGLEQHRINFPHLYQ